MNILADAQVPYPLVDMLRRIGWDVRRVQDEGTQDEKDDAKHLIMAREQGRIFLTFDVLTGEEAARIAAELVLNGGKVLEIRRGPDQPFMKSLGRLLFHYPEWEPFLSRNEGLVSISGLGNNSKVFTPSQYSQTIRASARHHFEEYIKKWEDKAIQPPRRMQPKPPPEEQAIMFDEQAGI